MAVAEPEKTGSRGLSERGDRPTRDAQRGRGFRPRGSRSRKVTDPGAGTPIGSSRSLKGRVRINGAVAKVAPRKLVAAELPAKLRGSVIEPPS